MLQIEKVLETALEEAEAWQKLETWSVRKPDRLFRLEISAAGVDVKFRIGSTTHTLESEGISRHEAVTGAAVAWVDEESNR